MLEPTIQFIDVTTISKEEKITKFEFIVNLEGTSYKSFSCEKDSVSPLGFVLLLGEEGELVNKNSIVVSDFLYEVGTPITVFLSDKKKKKKRRPIRTTSALIRMDARPF